jgi:hypothetical protein
MTTVKLVKGVKGASKPKMASPKAAPVSFTILDTQDDVFAVQGVDAAGSPVDISAVATLAVTSDNLAVATVDAPVGMTATGHFLTAGTVNLTFTATWNTPGTPPIGPFTFVLPVVVSGSVATGLVVTPGTPTTR